MDDLNFYACSKAARQLVNFVPAVKLFTSYIVPNESYNLVTAAELIINLCFDFIAFFIAYRTGFQNMHRHPADF